MLICCALCASTLGAHGAGKKHEPKSTVATAKPTTYFIELSQANFEKEFSNTGAIPFLLETCVPEACKLEESELNAVGKALAGKIKVVRLNTAEQPGLFTGFLLALGRTSGNPFLPTILRDTPARWLMHTVMAPDTTPIFSLSGLMTGDMLGRLVETQVDRLQKPAETSPSPDAGSKVLGPQRLPGAI
jgi:hypothetical protein